MSAVWVATKVVAAGAMMTWLYVGMLMRMRSGGLGSLIREVFWELRPLYLPGLGVIALGAAERGPAHFLASIPALLLMLFTWFAFKDPDDDDDRWKRRRKLAEKVTVTGGQLVVVPVSAR